MLSNRSFEDWRKDRLSWGRLVEVAAGAHLANQSLLHGMDLYYWREGNREVDFILRKGKKLAAIEIKSGTKTAAQIGLSEFSKKYPCRTLLVGSPELSLKEFLETPVSRWLEG